MSDSSGKKTTQQQQQKIFSIFIDKIIKQTVAIPLRKLRIIIAI